MHRCLSKKELTEEGEQCTEKSTDKNLRLSSLFTYNIRSPEWLMLVTTEAKLEK
jgi:hypothetical protein